MWLAASSRLPSDYFAILNGCVSTQRLHHCVSAWPCGQALSLTFRSLTARVTRRAATFQLHFSLALRPSTCFLSFGPLTARVARRVSVPHLYSNHDAQPMVGRIQIAFKLPCYPQWLCVHSDCADRIQAWPRSQALSLFFGPLTARVARRAATCQLHFSLVLRPSTCFQSFGPLTARVARRVSMPHL